MPRPSKRKQVSDQGATPTPKRIRGRKGALKSFPEMPIDILLQVIFYMDDRGPLTQCFCYLTLCLRFLATYAPLIYSI